MLAQIAQLQHMTMRELRQRWMKLHGTAAPTYARPFLVSRLAYRIQELAYGGLTPTAKRRLDAIADRLDQARQDQGHRKRRVEHARPVPGTRLIREWQGVQHCVTVLADGYDYQGRPYRSLSAVSKAIVGYAWNGPAFFGLRAQNRAGTR